MIEKQCNSYLKKIEKLKWQNTDLLQSNAQLRKENKELKQAYDTLKIHHSNLHDELNDLECENKELKSDIQYWKTLAESLAKKNNKGGF